MNMPITCLVVDDDIQARNALKQDLLTYCNGIALVGEAFSVATAVQQLEKLKPQLLLLDIKLGDGSGFDVLEKSSYKEAKTIFVTAYNEYAIKAFEKDALHYILKPVDTEALATAVEKASKLVRLEQQANMGAAATGNYLCIATSDGISMHQPNEIVYCEANRNYCSIVFATGEKLLTAKTLADMEQVLYGKGFERIHQSYIINLAHLKKYSNKEGGCVMLSGNTQLPVSRRKKPDLLKRLLQASI